ncbi:MAG: lecithin retinol acyltransferase family protein [Telluria sp.]
MDGPKHHALVLGRGAPDGVIYLAELMTHGYQIATYRDFHDRYVAFAPIQLVPNVGPKSNAEVAQDALAEIKRGGARYDLVANNCESFVNRAVTGSSTSSQVVNTAIGLAALFGVCYVMKSSGS